MAAERESAPVVVPRQALRAAPSMSNRRDRKPVSSSSRLQFLEPGARFPMSVGANMDAGGPGGAGSVKEESVEAALLDLGILH